MEKRQRSNCATDTYDLNRYDCLKKILSIRVLNPDLFFIGLVGFTTGLKKLLLKSNSSQLLLLLWLFILKNYS